MSFRTMAYGGLGLLLALCACSREVLPRQEEKGIPIHFHAGLNVSSTLSKADPAEAPTSESYLINGGNVVRVFGTWENAGSTVDVFDDVALTCTDSGESASPRYNWDYSPHQYWRQGGKYYFCSVFPSDVHPEFGSNGQRFVTTYSMLSDNFDMLIASGNRDNTDTSTPDNVDPVELNFRHACSAVRVVFSKGTEDPYRHYLLESFEMQYLHAIGVLVAEGADISLSSWNPAEYRHEHVWAWQAADTDTRIDVPKTYDAFKALDFDTYGWTYWHYAIPQSLTQDDGHRPAIHYGVYVRQCESDGEGGETLLYETEHPVYTTLELPLTYTDSDNVEHPVVWEPGKMYTYLVEIQKGDDHITVWVDDWDRYDVHVDDIVFE